MTFRIRKFCFILLALAAQCVYAQHRTITGVVTDSKQEPLIGVNVMVKGNTTGTITDIDGSYQLSVPSEKTVLVFSYIGYTPQEINVGKNTKINIVLKEDTQALDEVVVIGYGTQKKSDLTGAVGSVNTEDIVAKRTTSVMEALQGAVAGVQITKTTARAGSGFDIQIRGKSSIKGDSGPLYIVDGIAVNDIQFLNPQDIERIDILKDASSTAIYGSRATEGVVLVTTKSAANLSVSTKPTISYDGYYGVREIARIPDFTNGIEFMQYRFQRYTLTDNANTAHPVFTITDTNRNTALLASSPKISEMLRNGEYFDWKDYVTRIGAEQNHYLSISGATKDVNYHIGAGFQEEKGIYLKDDYKRFNFKGSVDANINSIFKGGFSVNLAHANQDRGSEDAIKNAFVFSPFAFPYDSEGNPYEVPGGKDALETADGAQFGSTFSPILDIQNTIDETRSFYVLGSAYLQANPLKNLFVKTTFSPNYSHDRAGFYQSVKTEARKSKDDYAKITNKENFSWTWDTQIDYSVEFNKAHRLSAMGIFSMYASNYEESRMEGEKFSSFTSFHNMGNAATLLSPASSYSEYSMMSYALRLNYSYKDRYLLTATMRADGSSRFADNNRWGNFPSVAVAWRASEESFLKYDWLSNLKLRLSFGVTGNNNVGNYAVFSSPSRKSYYDFAGIPAEGYAPNGLVNMGLTWEKSNELNLGLDFGFFNNRISGSVDIYNKLSKGLLMTRKLVMEMGYSSSLTDNVGKVCNKGIEVTLNTVNVQTKDFYWGTTFNFSYNKNEITELYGSKTDDPGNLWYIGQPVNVHRFYKYMGVVTDKEADYWFDTYGFPEGTAKIQDTDRNGTINDDDKILVNKDPKWIGSITSNLSWRNWDFSFNIYTKQDYTVRSRFLEQYLAYSARGLMQLHTDYYIPAGAPILKDDATAGIQENTHYGKYPYPNNTTANQGWGTYFSRDNISYVDATFVKVKNITLGYTLPQSTSSKIGLKSLRVYFNVLNPFVFTKYEGFDPEWANSELKDDGPSTVTYQFGVNLKF